MLLYIATR